MENKTPVTKVEKIPEKIVEKLGTIKKDIEEINSEFFNLANQLVGIQDRLQTLKRRREEKGENYSSTLNFAAGKLKLKKRTDYNWRFDGKDSFIGVSYTTPPTTTEETTPVEEKA